ncbi:hypothetical protein HAX54_027518 [Datura stramonium]|uniref:Uncharacterized protein n=1 Tax=Datura stramonium TaxID=4076 RepID=A0ABS8S8T5_DATST|nr:hypothetical protein [Datura stramonium]
MRRCILRLQATVTHMRYTCKSWIKTCKMQVQHRCRSSWPSFLPHSYDSPVFRGCPPAFCRQADTRKAPSSSNSKGKGKTKATSASTNTRAAIIFCMPDMKAHYVICTGRSFITKKRFDLEGQGNEFPNITAQFSDRQWHMFVEPVLTYYPNLVPDNLGNLGM